MGDPSRGRSFDWYCSPFLGNALGDIYDTVQVLASISRILSLGVGTLTHSENSPDVTEMRAESGSGSSDASGAGCRNLKEP